MTMTERRPSGRLTLEDVVVGYGDHVVLRGITASLERGEAVALIGPNGVGKSTLLKTCMHLVEATSGRVCIDGEPVGSLDPTARARRLAMLPQSVSWSFPFRVL